MTVNLAIYWTLHNFLPIFLLTDSNSVLWKTQKRCWLESKQGIRVSCQLFQNMFCSLKSHSIEYSWCLFQCSNRNHAKVSCLSCPKNLWTNSHASSFVCQGYESEWIFFPHDWRNKYLQKHLVRQRTLERPWTNHWTISDCLKALSECHYQLID